MLCEAVYSRQEPYAAAAAAAAAACVHQVHGVRHKSHHIVPSKSKATSLGNALRAAIVGR
jgi:hypothetical protein